MPSDVSSPSDSPETKDTPSPATTESRPLSDAGRNAMQGGSDLSALQARVDQLQTETYARESAELSALQQQETAQVVEKPQDVMRPPEDTNKADAPQSRFRTGYTERGNVGRVETGGERTEVESFDSFRPLGGERGG